LRIETRRLTIRNGASVSSDTRGIGNGGNLTITADEIEVFNESAFRRTIGTGISTEVEQIYQDDAGNTVLAEGKGGNLTLVTRRLSVRSGANISSTTFGIGNAGDLTVRASESIILDGDVPLIGGSGNGQPGGLLAQVDNTGRGNAGDLTVITKQLSISNGSKVQAASFGHIFIGYQKIIFHMVVVS
jgi:large exoprotein involved in heme utilization and adhesion